MNGKIKITRTSKKWLVNSLFDLMRNKKYEDITVSEICDNAELSRRTFYRLFKNKNDLLDFYFGQIINEYSKIAKQKLNNMKDLKNISFQDIIYIFLNFWWSEKDNAVILIKQNLFIDIFLKNINRWKSIYKTFELSWHFDEDTENFKYISNFFIGGYINLISYWLISDNPKSTKEISEIIYSAIKML